MEAKSVDRSRPVTIITGAYGGLGSALAHRLVREGHNLVVSGPRKTELAKLAKQLRAIPTDAQLTILPVEADVTKSDQCEYLIRAAWNISNRIDVLVNNAAEEGGGRDPKSIDSIIDVNLKGLEYCSYYALEQMQKQTEGGMLVNIASTSGIRFKPKEPVYSSSKFGVLAYSASLYLHYKDKGDARIRVLCFAPGGMATRLNISESKKVKADLMNPIKVADLLTRLIANRTEGLVVLERNNSLNHSNFSFRWNWISHKKLDEESFT